MRWDFLAAAAIVVILPIAVTDPRVARRIVYSPNAPWIASAAALLAGVALFLRATQIIGSTLAIGLCAPLIQIGIVQIAFRTFVRIKHREPVDTWLNFTSGLVADRAYAFVVLGGGIFVAIAAVCFIQDAT